MSQRKRQRERMNFCQYVENGIGNGKKERERKVKGKKGRRQERKKGREELKKRDKEKE